SSVTFNHRSGKMLLGQIVEVGENPRDDYVRGCLELDRLEEKLSFPVRLSALQEGSEEKVVQEIEDSAYAEIVGKAKQHILAGDVFQIVPSRTFRMPCEDAFTLYRRLRQESRAPYLFYFDLGDRQI